MQNWNIALLASRQVVTKAATELMPVFSAELSKSAESFKMASLSENSVEATRLCHRMRGSAALYGFKLLADLLQATEIAIKSGELLPSKIAGSLKAVAAQIGEDNPVTQHSPAPGPILP